MAILIADCELLAHLTTKYGIHLCGMGHHQIGDEGCEAVKLNGRISDGASGLVGRQVRRPSRS